MMTMKKTMMIMNIRMKKKVLMKTKMKKNEKIFFRLIILKMHAQYDEIKKGKIIIIWFSKKTIFFPPSFNF